MVLIAESLALARTSHHQQTSRPQQALPFRTIIPDHDQLVLSRLNSWQSGAEEPGLTNQQLLPQRTVQQNGLQAELSGIVCTRSSSKALSRHSCAWLCVAPRQLAYTPGIIVTMSFHRHQQTPSPHQGRSIRTAVTSMLAVRVIGLPPPEVLTY
jgi:hypothetical protein